MEEVNPTPNVEIIGLEGIEDDVGKDVGREVEEVEGDCEPYKKKQRKKIICYLNIQYMVITAHFVDMDSKLQKRVLNIVEVHPPHTAVRLLLDSFFSYNFAPRWWNATFAMLSFALDFKQVFPLYQLRDPNYKCLLSEDDWQKVEEICSLLVHFNEVTKIILGSEYPTTNLILPELYNIKEILCLKFKNLEPWIENMARRMQQKFDKYWGSSNLLISIAVVLDPRNKMTFIEFAFPVIYSEHEATRQIAIKGKGLVVQTGRAKFEKFVRNVDIVQHVKFELDTYLQEGVYICEGGSTEFNALDWWKSMDLKFIVLSKMTCEILSIPITTVASKSTFSVGGRVIDTYRASLGTNTVQMLLCGSDWLLMSYESFNTSDEPSSPSVGSSTILIDMEEVNPTPNMEIIGLEGMEDDVGKDVGREVEEVEGDCEPYKKKQRKKSSVIW
nr:zinc finger BED domain-containing protein RICESLEEPER 2-like [Ipomoea batatas]